MQLTNSESLAVIELLKTMEALEIPSKREMQHLQEKQIKARFQRLCQFPDEVPQEYALSGLLWAYGFIPEQGHHGDHDGFHAAVRAVKDDLIVQCETIQRFILLLIKFGEPIPPAPAWRIAVILRRKKAIDLELRFLEVWTSKFELAIGQKFVDLKDRRNKLHAKVTPDKKNRGSQ